MVAGKSYRFEDHRGYELIEAQESVLPLLQERHLGWADEPIPHLNPFEYQLCLIFVIPWTVGRQATLSMGSSRQEQSHVK